MAECVTGAKYVQECVPEVLDLKRKVWGEVDKLVGTETILGTSTSCIGGLLLIVCAYLLHCTVPSKISDFMEHKAQFIVAHPCNPPYHTPMVELVPAPWTSTEVFALFSFCIVLPLYYVPNYIIALYLPLSTVSTQPCLTYL